MHGYQFTWERGRDTTNWVEIWLDRALVSRSWLEVFQNTKLSNLEVTTSDHTPILLEPEIRGQMKRIKRLKFENAWLRDPICRHIVEESWERHKGQSWNIKIKECSAILASWGNEVIRNFKKRIARSKKIIRTKGRRDEYSVKKLRGK